MKTIILTLLTLIVVATDGRSAEPNRLTAEEKAAGWRLVFDGASTKGWRAYKKNSFPAKGWRVEDGVLKKVGGEQGGDIITEEKFDNFEFQWDWRIAENGNNGIKYLVTEERSSAPGHEYQMIDDFGNPDGKNGPRRQTAAFYDVLPPAPDKKWTKSEEWHSSRVVVQGNRVEHWLDGAKVLEYELGSDEVMAAVQRSKFKNAKGFGTKITGHILLTDHHDECWYRNMKIRELPAKR